MPVRPLIIAEVLALRPDYFSGGARLTTGELMRALKIIAGRPVIRAIDDDATVLATDEGAVLELDPDGGSITVTLPAGLPIGFYASVRQVSAGTVSIEAGAGATVVALGSPVALELGGQWATASIEVRAAEAWHCAGQLAA